MGATLNDLDLLSAEITEPIGGNWSAELVVDSDKPIVGRCVLTIEGVTWLGTVARGEVEAGRFRAFVVGGNGALGKQLAAKHYLRGQMTLMLREIVSPGGEVISTLSDTAVTARSTSRWSRRRGTIGSAIAQVARESSAEWRVLRDGSIWLGKDTWPAASPEPDFEEIDRQPARITIAPEVPTLRPAVTLTVDGVGRKVISVTTRLDGGTLRQEVTFADEGGSVVDRMRELMQGIIEALFGHRMDYALWYPSHVVAQGADGTVDLYPDHEIVRGSGIVQVPLRHGLPGCTVQVKPGSRVILFFENGDSAKPAAALWPDGSSVLSITVTADTELRFECPSVTIDGALVVTGEVTAMSSIPLSTHKHPTAMGPSGLPIP